MPVLIFIKYSSIILITLSLQCALNMIKTLLEMMSVLDGILLPLKRVKECVRKSQDVIFSCSSKITIGSTVVVG